ncbi:MAG: hypothetical protein O6952_04300, partial [Planctomycetota bacterium]|nr:hypothetical protein [Planctomycetota bacterium]
EALWLFADMALGFHSSRPRWKAIDAGGGETYDYDDIWEAGFGPRFQLRLHYGITRGENTGLTIGPGFFIENGGYGTEGGTMDITLRDGTELNPQFMNIGRVLGTIHGRYLFSRGFFVGTQIGVGLGFTSEVEIGVTEPGGVETKMILFRRTQMISYDFNMRIGWRWAWSRFGLGFYFETGLGYVGSPRRGNYSGADPSPIRINYIGVALFLFEGGWSVLPPAR